MNFRNLTTENKVIEIIAKVAKSNILTNIIAIIIIWAFVSIPVWIYILFRVLISPVGFWQEIVVVVLCVVGIGWLQVLLLFLGIAATTFVISEGD